MPFHKMMITLGIQGYEILIDGKILTTPAHNVLIVPTAELAEIIAEEWKIFLFENTIRRRISIATFHHDPEENLWSCYEELPPLTRLVALAIDKIKNHRSTIIKQLIDILRKDYIRTFFLKDVYSLKQKEYFLQLNEWFKENYAIDYSKEKLKNSEIESIVQFLEERNCWALTVLYYLTYATKSFILSVALSHHKIDPSIAFALADNFLNEHNILSSPQRLMMRTHIIVAERFLKLSCCWERNTEPQVIHRLFSGYPQREVHDAHTFV